MILNFAVLLIIFVLIATPSGQMNPPRTERPEIPDLNVALVSESDSHTETAILSNQESQKPDQAMENTGIKRKRQKKTIAEKRERKSETQRRYREKKRLDYKNRFELGKSAEEIASMEQKYAHALEKDAAKKRRHCQAAWGRIKTGCATETDLKMQESSRKKQKKYYESHKEECQNKRKLWRAANPEKVLSNPTLRKRAKDEIPDLNISLISPEDSEVMSSHTLPNEPVQQRIKSQGILSKDEKRKIASIKQVQRAKEKRERFKNRHQLNLSESEIAKLEQYNKRRLEIKYESARRRQKKAWERHKTGEATENDMKIIERSRKSSKKWRLTHREQENERKKKWRTKKRDREKKTNNDQNNS